MSEGGWTEKQRIRVAEDKVHASIKETVSGSLREQGGTCSFQSLWAEGRRKLRRGRVWEWTLRRTFQRQEESARSIGWQR